MAKKKIGTQQPQKSYVIIDTSEQSLSDYGGPLKAKEYEIKILNLYNPKHSMHYNPFAYIHSESDIIKLTNNIVNATKYDPLVSSDRNKTGSEDFWIQAVKILYNALIGYIYYEAPKREQNFETLFMLLNAFETRKEDEYFKNAIDMLFKELEEKYPIHFAVRQYKKIKSTSVNTQRSIIITANAEISSLDCREISDIIEDDELELDKIDDKKTAMFIIVPPINNPFELLINIFLTQLFDILCEKADNVNNNYKVNNPIDIYLGKNIDLSFMPNYKNLKQILAIRGINLEKELTIKENLEIEFGEPKKYYHPFDIENYLENSKYLNDNIDDEFYDDIEEY